MRSSLLAVVASFGVAAFAQTLSDLPSCASACVGSNLGGCSTLDIKCICNNANLISSLSCCVAGACSASDQQKTINFASQLCAAQGITLPTTATCASTASSTSGSATGSSTASGSASASASSTGTGTTVVGVGAIPSNTSSISGSTTASGSASSSGASSSAGSSSGTTTVGGSTGVATTSSAGAASQTKSAAATKLAGKGMGVGAAIVGLAALL
ncbi:hypothetical protein BJ546DRAFT_378024 [Cryomyces antarcticus]